MNVKTSILSFLAAVAVIGALGVASFGQQRPASQGSAKAPSSQKAPAKAATVDHVAQGAVVTMTDKSIVVREKNKNMTFLIKPDTQKMGNIALQKQVTIHYRDENRQHIATSIQEMASPQAPAAKPKS